MIKVFISASYVDYKDNNGYACSLDNDTIRCLYNGLKSNYGECYLKDAESGLIDGAIYSCDSKIANMNANHLAVPEDVIVTMYNAMVEGENNSNCR
jgi:hypothetical protein